MPLVCAQGAGRDDPRWEDRGWEDHHRFLDLAALQVRTQHGSVDGGYRHLSGTRFMEAVRNGPASLHHVKIARGGRDSAHPTGITGDLSAAAPIEIGRASWRGRGSAS